MKSLFSRSLFIIFACLISSGLSWPLDSVLARGDSCINIAWIPDSINTDSGWYTSYGTYCTGEDSIYLHCDFIPGREYQGVAYSYGGEDPWYLFRGRLDSGYLVGSHQCHYEEYGDPSDTVTGTDCSGFLCHMWNVPRMSTSGLLSSSLFLKIDKKDIKAGDALVKASPADGYHAVLIAEADDLTEAVVWEASSTVFGCRERISDLNTSYWDPFTPLRYPEITKIVFQQLLSKKPIFSIYSSNKGYLIVSSFHSKRAVLVLHNLHGQLVKQFTIPPRVVNYKPGNGTYKYIARGVYVASVITGEGFVYSKRIVQRDIE